MHSKRSSSSPGLHPPDARSTPLLVTIKDISDTGICLGSGQGQQNLSLLRNLVAKSFPLLDFGCTLESPGRFSKFRCLGPAPAWLGQNP